MSENNFTEKEQNELNDKITELVLNCMGEKIPYFIMIGGKITDSEPVIKCSPALMGGIALYDDRIIRHELLSYGFDTAYTRNRLRLWKNTKSLKGISVYDTDVALEEDYDKRDLFNVAIVPYVSVLKKFCMKYKISYFMTFATRNVEPKTVYYTESYLSRSLKDLELVPHIKFDEKYEEKTAVNYAAYDTELADMAGSGRTGLKRINEIE